MTILVHMNIYIELDPEQDKSFGQNHDGLVNRDQDNWAGMNEFDFSGYSPYLMYKIVGRRPNVPSSIYCSKLMYMILARASIHQIRTFLEHNSEEVHVYNGIGYSPLLLAALYSRTLASEELVQMLIDFRADVNAVTTKGESILSMVCSETCTSSTPGTIQILLECGANPNVQDANGITPLIYAAVHVGTGSCWETVDLLLQFDADPNIQCKNGSTALIAVITAGHRDYKYTVAKLLIEAGADVNIVENGGHTALHRACGFICRHRIYGLRVSKDDILISLKLIELLVGVKKSVHSRNVDLLHDRSTRNDAIVV